MDDAVHVIDITAPRGVLGQVYRLTRRNMYGEELQLLRTAGKEAFGFRWTQKEGVLFVEQELKWIRDYRNLSGISDPSLFYDSLQLDTNKQRKGILKGYFLRLGDCANIEEHEVITRFQRLTSEIIEQGHNKKLVYNVITEASNEMLCDMRSVQEVVTWSREERQLFNMCHDFGYRIA